MSKIHTIPDLATLQSWANDADAALANLNTLLALVGDESEAADYATEALENCGSPLAKDATNLQRHLTDDSPTVVYWACTLISRDADMANQSQALLCKVLKTSSTPAFVKHRALLALTKATTFTDESKALLKDLLSDADPKLSKMAQEAL